ncbi:arylamine N-acetyltransferase [Streptomyces sp. NA02950]|uniref:arylamine N-acetyltransferase family protein n=1 Tax=Streptomyces sp. NA02950 TaxID=2742137 RepID=UPI00158FE9EE|nr:arylamine N-acetyltransferase [Streptomyces sp. NA02950]QKV93213.1 arylamine N-acetyltransferase [Streptomyces sp. NA02950]
MNDAPSETAPQLDLDAYLTRIGWTGARPPAPTAETLRAVHLAHVTSIPFENIQPLLGSAPSLALPDLEAKLVRSRRGGYCYEQNTLLSTALGALGFGITGLAARVRLGAAPGTVRPRSHMVLLVEIPGEPQRWIADVGFGAIGGLHEAVPFITDTELPNGTRRHRYIREPHPGGLEDLWVFQALHNGVWEDQYAFSREPFIAADYAVINWHTATNPRSPFQHTLQVQRTGLDLHLELSARILTETHPDGTRKRRELADNDEVLRVLAADFGIDLPSDTVLPL